MAILMWLREVCGVKWQFLDLRGCWKRDGPVLWSLVYLYDKQQERWDAETMTKMLHACGIHGYGDCAEWLIAHETQFPEVLGEYNTEAETWVRWKPSVIAVARRHGCTASEVAEPDAENDDTDDDAEVNDDTENEQQDHDLEE